MGATQNRFPQFVERNLRYWLSQLGVLDDEAIKQRQLDYPKIEEAARWGLRFDSTRKLTGCLCIKMRPWIERERHEQTWLPLVQAVLTSAETSTSQYPQLLLLQGLLLRLSGQLDQAQAALERADQLQSSHTPNPQVEAQVAFNLANVYLRRKQYAIALQQAYRAREQYEQANSIRGLAAALNTLGQIEHELGNYAEANRWFEQALASETQVGEPTRTARVLNNLAFSLHYQQKVRDAQSYHERALRLLRTTNNVTDQVKTYIYLGVLHASNNNIELAEANYHFADGLLERYKGLPYLVGLTKTNLGKVAQERKQYDAAIIHFEASIAAWRAVGEDVFLANSLGALAEIMTARRETEVALTYYDRAIELLHQHHQHADGQRWLKEFTAARRLLQGDLESAQY